MRKRSPPEPQPRETTPPIFKRPFNLFAKENRGILLDVVVFIANIFLMRLMSTYVLGLFDAASNDDSAAQLILTLGCIGMWILPASGALLKRWHFHQRLRAEHKTIAIEDVKLAGCLFNPIFFFCLNLVVMGDSDRSRAVSRRAKRNGERCDLCSLDLARLDLNNFANLFRLSLFHPTEEATHIRTVIESRERVSWRRLFLSQHAALSMRVEFVDTLLGPSFKLRRVCWALFRSVFSRTDGLFSATNVLPR